MYTKKVGLMSDVLASVKDNVLCNPFEGINLSGRIILKNGFLVDPKNNLEEIKDISILNGEIHEVSNNIHEEKGDTVIDCDGLIVAPGLIDMHVHLGDLFEVSTNPIFEAAANGVTMGLSPGAGNTFMAPALLGAEIDRGLPLNLGVYQGAANVLSSRLSVEELIDMYKGNLDADISSGKMSRNGITLTTAALTVGIKDHMGHFIMSDENIDKIFEITSKAKMVYMSHTQDPTHAQRLAELSKGRPLHLGHATAAGCGSHMPAEEAMSSVVKLCELNNISAEFVTTMLRPGGGSKEGLILPKKAQDIAYKALENKTVKILISDGQNDATMKGFGDTRDNIPSLIELADMGVLSLSDAIATMTKNTAELMCDRTDNKWWIEKIGHLGAGALANITVINRNTKSATYTIVNGEIVSFEGRVVRRGIGAGGYISKFGMSKRTGVGDIVMFNIIK